MRPPFQELGLRSVVCLLRSEGGGRERENTYMMMLYELRHPGRRDNQRQFSNIYVYTRERGGGALIRERLRVLSCTALFATLLQGL